MVNHGIPRTLNETDEDYSARVARTLAARQAERERADPKPTTPRQPFESPKSLPALILSWPLGFLEDLGF